MHQSQELAISLVSRRKFIHALENSPSLHQYATVQELLFELRLRENIIKAARMLYESQVQFAPFRTSKFNPLIWKKTNNGYLLNPNVLPSHAINDVFINSREYAFECTTAIVIIFYKAVLDSISIGSFNAFFQGLLVWDWHHDHDLGITTKSGRDFIPGDAVYFFNPEYDQPVWTGENAIYLGGNYYFWPRRWNPNRSGNDPCFKYIKEKKCSVIILFTFSTKQNEYEISGKNSGWLFV